MAKLLLYSDNHWCKYSSIIRSNGLKYSTRLENQIESINWAEKLAVDKGCSYVMMLGDFFDKQQLDAMELTALNDIEWCDLPHYILCGNHELGLNDMSFSSAHLFNIKNGLKVIDKPTTMDIDGRNVCFLPYVIESNRKKLSEYFNTNNNLILSHNDIKDLWLGGFLTQTGFEVDDIESNCDLFINGHLHNGGKISDKIINIGNLTGQNFSEDAFKYDHVAFVVDTDTLNVDVYENPFALKFYKIDFTEKCDIDYINEISFKVHRNAAVSIKCYSKDLPYLKGRFGTVKVENVPQNCNVIASRFIIEQEHDDEEINSTDTLSVDHLQKFKDYVVETFGSSEDVLFELGEVTKCE